MNFHLVDFDIGPFNDPQGDFDWSGLADGEDLLAWQRGFGSTTSLLADANGSGTVTGEDLSVWEQGFGVSPSGAAAAPEPGTMALAFAAALSAWAQVRRRSARHFDGIL